VSRIRTNIDLSPAFCFTTIASPKTAKNGALC
jgi:hypothetical protein